MTKANQPTIVVATDKDHAAQCTADLIHETVREKPSAVLGLATGGTPVGVYHLLVERFQAGELDFSKVTGVVQVYTTFFKSVMSLNIKMNGNLLYKVMHTDLYPFTGKISKCHF